MIWRVQQHLTPKIERSKQISRQQKQQIVALFQYPSRKQKQFLQKQSPPGTTYTNCEERGIHPNLVEDHRGRPGGAGQVEPEGDGEAPSPADSGRYRVQLDAHAAEVAVAVAPAAFRFRRRHPPLRQRQVRVLPLPSFGASARDDSPSVKRFVA